MRFELEALAPARLPRAPMLRAACSPAHRPSPERVPEMRPSTQHAPPPDLRAGACSRETRAEAVAERVHEALEQGREVQRGLQGL